MRVITQHLVYSGLNVCVEHDVQSWTNSFLMCRPELNGSPCPCWLAQWRVTAKVTGSTTHEIRFRSGEVTSRWMQRTQLRARLAIRKPTHNLQHAAAPYVGPCRFAPGRHYHLEWGGGGGIQQKSHSLCGSCTRIPGKQVLQPQPAAAACPHATPQLARAPSIMEALLFWMWNPASPSASPGWFVFATSAEKHTYGHFSRKAPRICRGTFVLFFLKC